ncbi:hypothetical protein BKA70DRAFT_839983 [Coprinopsis sp. MPI-PUGE-AT-0042]|nr:hypothetical protein BKA70DRAFT_839983 [Coprinopsis sp. MPI-PUGE-AT-0042]
MDGPDRRVRTSMGDLVIPPPPTSTPPLPPIDNDDNNGDDDEQYIYSSAKQSSSEPPCLPPVSPLGSLLSPEASVAEFAPAVPRDGVDALRATQRAEVLSEWLVSPTSPSFPEAQSRSATPGPPSPTCQTPTPPADATGPSTSTPSPEPTSAPSSPSSVSSLSSLPSSASCSCCKGETGERCRCSYATRLTRWVREQSHFAELGEDKQVETLDSKPTEDSITKSSQPIIPNKWYWKSNTASFKSSSGRQSWEEGVRADSPLLGDFAFECLPEAGPSSRVAETDAVVRKQSPPLLRTASLDPEPGTTTGPLDTESVTSPTDTFVSAISGGSESTTTHGRGDDDSTVSGHTSTAHGHDLDSQDDHFDFPQGRIRSQSASVVHELALPPRRGNHAHSQSVHSSPVNDDFQQRYQSALGAGLEPPFELERPMHAQGDSPGSSSSRSSNPIPNPLHDLLSTPPSMSPTRLMAPPPTATSFATPITPRSPTNFSTPRTPRTPPTLSTQPSMASLRHAVYIMDSEAVRERLDELVRRESRSSLATMVAAQQQHETSSPPPTNARFGRSRSHSLVSVVESEEDEEREDDYGLGWRSREDELGLGGLMVPNDGEEDDEDKRNTVCAGGLEQVVEALGLDRIDPVAASRERRASEEDLADLGCDVDYRTYLSERFVEDVEQAEEEEHEEREDEENQVSRIDEEDLEQFKDLFYRPSNPRPPLSHSVSVPAIPQASAESSPKHHHTRSVALPTVLPASNGFYQSEKARSSAVYVGLDSPATHKTDIPATTGPQIDSSATKEHKTQPSFSSSVGSSSTRSSRSYGTAPVNHSSSGCVSPTPPPLSRKPSTVASATLSRNTSISGISQMILSHSPSISQSSSLNSIGQGMPISRNPSINRIPSMPLQHKKSQPSLGNVGRSRAGSVVNPSAANAARSRAGSITANAVRPVVGQVPRSRAGSFTRPMPPVLDSGAIQRAMAMVPDVLASPAIEAVSATIRDSVAIGPPPRRPPPAPPLVVESEVREVLEEVGDTGPLRTEEWGYFPKQLTPDATPVVVEEGEGESTIRGRGQAQQEVVLSSKWSIASSSQESLELKEKEKDKGSKKKEKEKAKSAPSSPGTKRKSIFGKEAIVGAAAEGQTSPPEAPVGKRGRLASFISKFRGQDKSEGAKKSVDTPVDDGEDVIHIRGDWEPVPPVPPVPANPPPLPPSLKAKISQASLRGGRPREDSWNGASIPPTPSTFISDWDASPSRPDSGVFSSPRESRAFTPQSANRMLDSNPQSISRARSHSHLSLLSIGTGVAPALAQSQSSPIPTSHTSPPPSPLYVQAGFPRSSSLASLGMSPPPTAGFYVAGAGFPRSVTSSPRSSFQYPSVPLSQLPIGLHQASTSPHASSPLSASTTNLVQFAAASPRRLTLSSIASFAENSNSGHSLPTSPVDSPTVGSALLSDRQALRRSRGGSAGLAYDEEEERYDDDDDMDSESLLLEEAKDILATHSYAYDSGSSRRHSGQDGEVMLPGVEDFEVGHRSQGSRSSSRGRHSRSQSATHSVSHSSNHSRSSSLLRLKDPIGAVAPAGQRTRRLAPSASSPDVSRRSGGSHESVPPPPVPPKDNTYETLTSIASHRQKLSLSPAGPLSAAPSPTSAAPSPSMQYTVPQSQLRFPGAPPRQPSEATHSVVSALSSGSTTSGRSTPATGKVGSFMTRLRLKSSPSLGSLKSPGYTSNGMYMPLDSPPVPTRPPAVSRVTTSTVPTLADNPKSKFFAKMMGKGRGDATKKSQLEEEAELDEELKNLDPSFMVGGAGGMIGISKAKPAKGKRALTKEEQELEAELRKMEPSMVMGSAAGMIGLR